MRQNLSLVLPKMKTAEVESWKKVEKKLKKNSRFLLRFFFRQKTDKLIKVLFSIAFKLVQRNLGWCDKGELRKVA